jgi:hypothetical protein
MIITGLLLFVALMMFCCVLLVMDECDYYEQQEYDAVLYSTSDIGDEDQYGFGMDHWNNPPFDLVPTDDFHAMHRKIDARMQLQASRSVIALDTEPVGIIHQIWEDGPYQGNCKLCGEYKAVPGMECDGLPF